MIGLSKMFLQTKEYIKCEKCGQSKEKGKECYTCRFRKNVGKKRPDKFEGAKKGRRNKKRKQNVYYNK